MACAFVLVGLIVGFVDRNTSEGKPLYNAAALIAKDR